ncbi:MAG TPA: phosphate ABC transporter ATP-binding protein [Chloroflexi bacterium]|nr:phosphate ABC transporter ATP-binding protein [Chloroflexota bacterium]
MKPPVYRLTGVEKRYGQRCVLRVEQLEVEAGRILALVGPSGAGKSTLLRLLNFLERPDAGQIEFEGQPIPNNGEVDLNLLRKVTTVFQQPRLLDRSVVDNVHYGLRLRGIKDAKAEVEAVLDRLGLKPLVHQRARTLSGGEAQRVALARALVLQPEVLLLDEPTANLDPYHVGLIEEVITEANRQQGTTMVLVTHNIFQARRLADRVAFLLNGSIVEVAEKEDFFTWPQDPRTQAFIQGDMVY